MHKLQVENQKRNVENKCGRKKVASRLSDFRRHESRCLFLCYNESTNGRFSYFLAPVAPKLDSAIHRINLYSVDNAIGFPIKCLSTG